MITNVPAKFAALLGACAFAFLSAASALAQTASGTIHGSIVTQDNGFNVSGATVTLDLGTTPVAVKTSDANGQYVFTGLAAGIYSIVIQANGYVSTRIQAVVVDVGATTTVRVPIARAASGESALRVIGSTKSSGISGNTVAATTTIQYDLDPQTLGDLGYVSASQALGNLPGVNLSGDPHSVGDDTSIDIRGMGAGEVRPLIDGHPIGPVGVLSNDYYNYANSSFSLLQNIQVTLGSGASGLYGVDVIGGTIDFQTLQPTLRPSETFKQSAGNDGTLGTSFASTGTVGRFGYAVGHAVEGTYGNLAPNDVFQGARPNNNENLPNGGACTASNDITTCNTALNTYTTSQDYKLSSDLSKLRYTIAPGTALTFTAYDSVHHSDSTGNGDNDNVPYLSRVGQIESTPQTCPGGYLVTTNANPNACLTAQQWALASSGPDGGGANRNRGTVLEDFTAALTSQIGFNSFSLSAYSDYYNFHKYSQEAAGYDPTGTFFVGGGTYQDDYLTHGVLATDDIAGAKNDFGFGYFIETQREYGDNLAYDSTGNDVYFVPQPELTSRDYSFFIRENYTPTNNFAVYLNAWDRRDSVTQKTTLDPRASIVYKPTSRDVVRLTAGEADGDPSIAVATNGQLSGFSNASSLNPVCGGQLNAVATGGNGDLEPERSRDIEAAVGHRFWDDTALNLTGYVSSVNDQLYTGTFPITATALANPLVSGELGEYALKINSICGTDYSAANVSQVLGLSGVFNANTALFRGIEATGRLRLTPTFYVDGEYDVQSAQQFGESTTLLAANPFLLNGGQIVEIPLQKASLAFNYVGGRTGLNAQIQGNYIGVNNTLNRPAYEYANLAITKRVNRNVTIGLAVFNLFNSNEQNYGYFGEQVPHAVNPVAAVPGAATGLQQALAYGFSSQDEEDGMQGTIGSLTVTLRF
jgi:outer membrane receptor protein involved in Fe transport